MHCMVFGKTQQPGLLVKVIHSIFACLKARKLPVQKTGWTGHGKSMPKTTVKLQDCKVSTSNYMLYFCEELLLQN